MAAKKTKKSLLLIILVILLAGAGVWFVSRKPSSPPIRHVVLISMDTTRADHLSCYGYERETTPNIDALASQGYLFSNTVTPIPLTLPAHTSMLTGTIPPYHGRHDNIDSYFDPSHVTLAQLLKKKGYSTGGFVGAQILNGRHGFNRGFDHYDDLFAQEDKGERRAGEVNQMAFQWLEKQKDNPVFLFLHYYDPHTKYDPPEPFAAKFKESPYAGEIAYTDHCIGEVIAKLKSLGMYESSLIIVTGDHGEMLGEHGEDTHMFFIYQSAIKVPFVCKLPGSNTPHKIDDIAGIVDIVPTVCNLLDIEPPAPIQGKNLAGYFSNKPPESEDRYLFCESLVPTKFKANSLLGMVGNRWKYIQTTRPELYDIQQDPGELTNLVETEPHRARILKDKLAQVLEQTVRKGNGKEGTPLDAESIKHLESLGYITGSSVKKDFSFDQTKPDPKDMIVYHKLLLRGGLSLLAKDVNNASILKDKLTQVLNNNKGKKKIDPKALIDLHKSLLDDSFTKLLSDPNKASSFKDELAQALDSISGKDKMDPNVLIDLHKSLKNNVLNMNKNTAGDRKKPDALTLSIPGFGNTPEQEQEAKKLEETLELMSKDKTVSQTELAKAHKKLGLLRLRQKKTDMAIVQLKESIKLDGKQPDTLNVLARILLNCPNQEPKAPSKGLEFARQACELTQSKNPLHLETLAVAYASLDNFSEAAKTIETALAQAKGDQKLVSRLKKQLDLYKIGLTK